MSTVRPRPKPGKPIPFSGPEDDFYFIEDCNGEPYPIDDNATLAMFLAKVKTYDVERGSKHFKRSRASLLELGRRGVACRAAATAEAVSVTWFEAIGDARVAKRLAFYERSLGSVPRADFLVAILDEWDQCDPEEKNSMMLESIRYRAEEPNVYDHDIGPVDSLHFRMVNGEPIPLPIELQRTADNVKIFDVQGMATASGWSRSLLVTLHQSAFPPKGGE